MFGVRSRGGLSTTLSRPLVLKQSLSGSTCFSTSTCSFRKEGDISSVFVSLSSKEEAAPLDERFAAQKKRLLAERGEDIKKSWDRLLNRLREEIGTIERHGPNIVPSIDFKDIHVAPEEFQRELRKRGVAVVRGVIPQDEARGYKEAIEAYARANPGTKGVLDPIASQNPDSALTL